MNQIQLIFVILCSKSRHFDPFLHSYSLVMSRIPLRPKTFFEQNELNLDQCVTESLPVPL